MKIAIVHNRDYSGVINRFGQVCPEKYGERAIIAVISALQRAGHDVLLCEGDKKMLRVLESFMPADKQGQPTGLVFNMAYGIQGNCRYTHVPAMLEMAGVPYTGSDPLGHALALDKVITKDLMRQAGIPTPSYCVLKDGSELATGLRFPVIVKPRHESTSFGLKLVTNPADLAAAVDEIVQQYRQDALVEEYIDGREVCVGLLGTGDDVEVLPLVEQDFSDRQVRLMTWEDKSHKSVVEPRKICPANIDGDLVKKLCDISVATFRACHCRDYARVDIRIDEEGNPYVLEINSMASLGPTGSYVLAAQTAGYTMDGLINRIVDVAAVRSFGKSGSDQMLTWVGAEGNPEVLKTSCLCKCNDVAASLDRMETAAHPGNTQDRGRLASCRVSTVLEMALPSPVDGRAKAGQPTDSGFNLSDGG